MADIMDILQVRREQARDSAAMLMWGNIEGTAKWNPHKALSGAAKNRKKVELQRAGLHPVLVSFSTSFVGTATKVQHKEMREILLYGAGRRLRSISRAAKQFSKVYYPGRTEVATDDEIADLENALLLIYLSIPAFFDALFVASLRAFEPKGFHEKNYQLFSKRYLEQAGLPDLYPDICLHLQWHNRVRAEMRHRYAHNVPPYVPPVAYSNAEAARYNELQALEWKDYEALDELRAEKKELGQFCPFIRFIEEGKLMPLYTVYEDLLTFQFVALTIFEALWQKPKFRGDIA